MTDKHYTVSVCTDSGTHVHFRQLPESMARALWQLLNRAQLVRTHFLLPSIEQRLERWEEGDEPAASGENSFTVNGVLLHGLTQKEVYLLQYYANDANVDCPAKTYWASMQYYAENMRLVGALDTVMTRHPVRFVAEFNAEDLPNKAFLCSWQEIDHQNYAALKEAYDFADTDQQYAAGL